MVQLCMARLAQAHKVAFPVIAAPGNRQDVMHFLDRGQPSSLQTHLAEGVGLGVAVTDALPCSAVLPVHVRRAFVPVVAVALRLCVFLAVLTAVHGKPRTAGGDRRDAVVSLARGSPPSAELLTEPVADDVPALFQSADFSVAHKGSSFAGHKKSPTGLLPRGSSCTRFLILPLYLFSMCQTTAKCVNFNPAPKNSSEPRRECGEPCGRIRSTWRQSAPRCGCQDSGMSEEAVLHGFPPFRGIR